MVEPAQAQDSAKSERDEPKPPSTLSILRRLARLSAPEITKLSIGACAMIISSAGNLMVPTIVGCILDRVTGHTPKSRITSRVVKLPTSQFLAGCISIYAASACASVLRLFCLNSARDAMARRLRSGVFTAILGQPMAYFDRSDHTPADLTNLIREDVEAASNAIAKDCVSALRGLNSLMGGSLLLYTISPQLTLLATSVLPPLGLGMMVCWKRIAKLRELIRDKHNAAISSAADCLEHVSTVKYYGAEARETARFSQAIASQELSGLQSGFALREGLLFGGLSLGVNLALLAVLSRGGQMVSSGVLSSGDLFKFSIYSGMLGAGAAGFAGAAKDVSKAAASARRVFELVDQHALIAGAQSQGKQLVQDAPIIRFDNVRFRYSPEAPPVLQGLNLTLAPGRVTALVGNSGCGKTTVVQLLAKLRAPEGGKVLFGDTDMAELSTQWLRDQVAVVEQNPTLFNASIYENIVFGWRPSENLAVSLQEVHEAAKQANAHEFIMGKPEGYDTQVGPQGACLSGGQVQRIAIARALLRKPKVLVFDEATSAMHGQAEGEVHRAILGICAQEAAQCAVLLITHRLYLLEQCMSIHVLHRGRIVQSGSFEELQGAPGAFQELIQAVTPQTPQ